MSTKPPGAGYEGIAPKLEILHVAPSERPFAVLFECAAGHRYGNLAPAAQCPECGEGLMRRYIVVPTVRPATCAPSRAIA